MFYAHQLVEQRSLLITFGVQEEQAGMLNTKPMNPGGDTVLEWETKAWSEYELTAFLLPTTPWLGDAVVQHVLLDSLAMPAPCWVLVSQTSRSGECPISLFCLASVFIFSFAMVEEFCRQPFVSRGLQVGTRCTKALEASGSCPQFQPDPFVDLWHGDLQTLARVLCFARVTVSVH